MSKRTYTITLVAIGIFCVLDLFFPPKHHAEYFWHVMPAFEAFYGFLGCTLIVVVSKAIGKHWLWQEATTVPLPKRAFAQDQDQGTIRRWFVSEGDQVDAGQDMVEVEIGDARLIIGSPQAGTIMRRFVDRNDFIHPGETLVDLKVSKYDVQEQVDDKVIIHG
ncbi:lipoyl domain-containing protein [Desulfohalobium retbaense]|mgnify:CR=1 FL=1|uniref:Biotin/lipoyl attachment domain-containing protein n=1 Tax=Desulfohalobium retbaense (strain ATCC 49708 / DSM 5692 / JCM 16813 / HR100) TaxID=485915 RepID=C8X0Y4_DESRD|nr:lipoyl domain-containing protein [Desulfohalobium retbaense]ACV68081.1 biotin/lipoyl attachment domain-containing protein [Desulfohalobium retbaense DSM 5692]